jgi:two-component system, cell cycle sensor histidine kinase and response regulator CckA
MEDQLGTNPELIHENALLKQKIQELEISEAELIRTKEELRNSERSYRSLFETSQDSIFVVNQETGSFISANTAACQLYGYTQEEFLKMRHVDISAEPEKTKSAVRNYASKIDIRMHRKKDGNIFPVEIDGGYFVQDGHTFYTAFIRDITERRNAEENLVEYQKRLHDAYKLAHIGAWGWNPETDIVTWTEEVYHIAGLDPMFPAPAYAEQLKLFTPESWAALKAAALRAMGTGEPYQLEVELIRPDGNIRSVHWFGSVKYDPSGRINGLYGIIQDITEQKEAEEVLRKSEERFKLSMEVTNDGLWDWNISTGTAYLNPGYYLMLGYEVGAFPPFIDSWMNLLHPEDREKAQKHSLDCITGKTDFFEFESRMKTKNGEWLWVLNRGKCVERDEQGHALRLLGTNADITERKRAADVLRIQNELALALTQTTDLNKTFEMCLSAAICISDMDCGGVYLFDEITGGIRLASSQGLTETLIRELEYYGPDSPNVALVQNGNPVYFSKNDLIKTGALFDDSIHCVGVIPIITEGKPVACLNVGSYSLDELPEYRRPLVEVLVAQMGAFIFRAMLYKQLKESEDYFRSITEQMSDVVYVTDSNGTITFMSPSAEQTFGFSPYEMEGRPFIDFMPESDISEGLDAFIKLVKTGEPIIGVEFPMKRKDGSVFPGELDSSIYQKDRFSGTIGTIRDITKRKLAEIERQGLTAQLQQAQKMEAIGRLAGGIAHDFNNMLSVILGNTDLALMGDTIHNEPVINNLQEIRNAAIRSANLTRQLLAFARKQIISPKMLDLNDTIEKALKMIRRLIGEDISLEWLPDKNLWPVKMDPSQVDQIMTNLCINAKDSITDKGMITIKTGTAFLDIDDCLKYPECVPGEYVMLEVSDNGCGMNKDILDNLFEPFFTTKDISKGTGLGLATVFGIVKQNKGFIIVNSEPGQGATFKIYLPNSREEAVIKNDAANDFQVNLKGSEIVLLVEDEPAVLKIEKAKLQLLGYNVLAAESPMDAIRLAKGYTETIHLLISDVVMPDMNGKELAEQLKLIHPELKCLFMSGYTADVIARKGLLEEGVNFVSKPFSIDDLALKVREILDSVL